MGRRAAGLAGLRRLVAAKSRPACPQFGLSDLAPLIFSWPLLNSVDKYDRCKDPYRASLNEESLLKGPWAKALSEEETVDGVAMRYVRGPGWATVPNREFYRLSFRKNEEPGTRKTDIGFRCVLEMP